jgi:hypothetical protein
MVSDGGMINGYGSYRWIIAKRRNGKSSRIYAKLQSRGVQNVGGTEIHTTRVHLYWELARTQQNNSYVLHQFGLVQRIGWHEKRIVTTPKEVIQADYKLEAAIKDMINTLQTNKIFVKEKHVSGHQDRHAEYQNLSHEEQLTVEADNEATKALHKHLHQGEYSQMPTTRSMLYHNGRPVTNKKAETLHQAYEQIGYSKHVTLKEQLKQLLLDLAFILQYLDSFLPLITVMFPDSQLLP